MWISKRNSQILKCLVDLYIATQNPVSSLQISKVLQNSSSGLRKELQVLEQQGYLYKPFASSGRIPTNKGIKAYVRRIQMETDDRSDHVCSEFLNDFDISTDPDYATASESIVSALSETTQHIGFIFLHSIFELSFKRIKLVKMGSHRLMVLILSPNNWTFSRVVSTRQNYSDGDLRKWEQTLNTDFRGNNLNTTFKKIRNRLSKDKEKYRNIYNELYFLLNNRDLDRSELSFKGELSVFDHGHGITDYNKIKGVFEILKEKEKLSSFLSDLLLNDNTDLSVLFGKETGMTEFDDLILITSNFYHAENKLGNIGVIGPRYLHYKETMKRVNNYSAYFSEMLSKGNMEV